MITMNISGDLLKLSNLEEVTGVKQDPKEALNSESLSVQVFDETNNICH